MPPPPSADEQLSSRGAAVLPWHDGVYGHMSIGNLHPGAPQFYERGEGARIWDVDGNSYIDLMSGWGPVLLGRAHPEVDAAARAEQERGDCLNGPTPRMVELAELLTETVSHADWVMLVKNGTDATTACAMIARAATGRKTLLVARGAYHGSAPWCTPSLVGTTPEDRANLVQYEFNDPASVEEALARCADDVAGIFVSPFRHDAGFDQELVDPAFARGLRDICDRLDAALILDDVRCGLRLHFGCSWEPLGVEPDLSAWGKGIGNGYPISAALGGERWRDAASSIYTTGSYWFQGPPMAAAIETISVMHRDEGVAAIRAAGERLWDGLAAQAEAHGLPARLTGVVQMPYMTFANDPDKAALKHFTGEAQRRGVFLHPAHNWFLSVAHTAEVIDEVLAATEAAFAAVRERFGDLGRSADPAMPSPSA